MDFRGIIDRHRKNEPDLAFFIVVFLLVGIGISMSYSASAIIALKNFHDPFYFLKRQLLWVAIGMVAMFIFQKIDYHIYLRFTKPLIGLSILFLILLLIPGIGKSVKGSVRWLSFGSVSVQPSEFVKICTVIYLSKVFSMEADGIIDNLMQMLIPLIVVALVFCLILLQPDFGTAMDLLIVAVLIMFVSGFPLRYMVGLAALSAPMFYLLIYQVDYRRDRIIAFLDPWEDRYGIGYHIIQSFTAFKLGGFLGVGLGYGTQKLKRLPEPHTDFIYAVIGEETGFLGCFLVLFLFGFFFWRGIQISLHAEDDFGRLLSIGLTLMLVVQALINIGVVTGTLPTTGIPLPFISYGGSSLLASMIAAGIILSVSRYSTNSIPEDLDFHKEG